jgi:hypothetical protein
VKRIPPHPPSPSPFPRTAHILSLLLTSFLPFPSSPPLPFLSLSSPGPDAIISVVNNIGYTDTDPPGDGADFFGMLDQMTAANGFRPPVVAAAATARLALSAAVSERECMCERKGGERDVCV